MQLNQLFKQWYTWVILGLAVVALLATAGIFVLLTQRVVENRNPATPAITLNTPIPGIGPAIGISPQRGSADTPITVTGDGWRPGDTLIIFIEAPSDVAKEPLEITSVVVGGDGRFEVVFTYPADKVWLSQPGFLITARSAEEQAFAVFSITSIEQIISAVTIEPAPAPTDVAIVTVAQLTLREGADTPNCLVITPEGGTIKATKVRRSKQ